MPPQINRLPSKSKSAEPQKSPITPLKVSAKGIFLFSQSGEFQGQTLSIPIGELTIGRGSQNTLKLTDPSVSRRHITIKRTNKGVYLRDEGSTFGTWINGKRIPSGVLILLNGGDVIQIGQGQVFVYYSGQ